MNGMNDVLRRVGPNYGTFLNNKNDLKNMPSSPPTVLSNPWGGTSSYHASGGSSAQGMFGNH